MHTFTSEAQTLQRATANKTAVTLGG